MYLHPTMPHGHAPTPTVASPAVRRGYRRGATLTHAGDAGDVLRIERGLVKLVVPSFDGRDRILEVLGAGDLLGEEAALGSQVLVADAVALSAVTVVACDRAAFLADLRRDPERAVAVAQRVARRLRGAWDDQARAYRPVRERLAAAMGELARRFGEPGADGWWVLECGLNHQAFAALVGAQRASVSVAMAEFRRAGAAFGARGTYTIDPARLRELAGASASAFEADADGGPATDVVRAARGAATTYAASASRSAMARPAA